MVFVVGVAAAIALGLGYVLQQRVAAHAAQSERLSFRLLLDLMHKPVWWGGIGCMIVGQLLGGLALQLAAVGLVEPLLSTSLLFALAIAGILSREPVRWYEVTGALLLSAALGVFIAVGDPRSSPDRTQSPLLIALAVCVVLGVVAALVAIGKRGGLVAESIVLATGAGLLYGLQDVAARAVMLVVDQRGFGGLPHSLWPYVLVGAAVIGIVLSQNAFRAARLDYSLPPIAAAEPVAGIALGVTLLGDVLSVSAGAIAIEALCLVGMVSGVMLIGRSPSLADTGSAGAPEAAEHRR